MPHKQMMWCEKKLVSGGGGISTQVQASKPNEVQKELLAYSISLIAISY